MASDQNLGNKETGRRRKKTFRIGGFKLEHWQIISALLICYDYIAVNLASNMLGMGGAATPAGIKAIGAMNANGEKATDNMCLLVVINATSIQLIPATVISIRAAAGSANAASIFLPTLIATLVSTFSGILILSVFAGLFRGWLGLGDAGRLGFWTTPVEIILTSLASFTCTAIACILVQRIPKVGKWIVG